MFLSVKSIILFVTIFQNNIVFLSIINNESIYQYSYFCFHEMNMRRIYKISTLHADGQN